MATPQSPFSFLDGLFERVAAGPQPPQWLVHEMQQRIVLFLNHVLMQEKEAMERLGRQKGLRGDKPAIRIEGDVQLAAEINWLVDHVRWDVEEDLARVIGDAPAHTVAQVASRAAQALRQFVCTRVAPTSSAVAPMPSVPSTPSAPNSGSDRAGA